MSIVKEASGRLSEKLDVFTKENNAKEGDEKMAGFNRVVLVGNLTRKPELKELPQGATVAEMRLAINEDYKNKEGEMVEKTCFIDIVAWGRQAEVCGEYLDKGSRVLIEGRLQLDAWKTPEGDARSKVRVRAANVKFLDKKKDEASADAPKESEAQEPAMAGEASDNAPF